MVRAGLLRQRITVENNEPTVSSTGKRTENWVEFAVLWADVRANTGSETFAAQQVTPLLSYNITVRYRSDLNETMRVILDTGAILDIQAILDPDGRKRMLNIICTERGHDD